MLLNLWRSALRQFRHETLATFAIAGTLALAVAAACTSFSAVKLALLDELPYPDGGRLVSLLTDVEGRQSPVSAHVLADLEKSGVPLTDFVSFRPMGFTFNDGESAEGLSGAAVSASFFRVLSAPALGSGWTEGDRDSVVISWGMWQRLFAGSSSIIGKRIRLDGIERTVTGVMPQSFLAPYFITVDVWAPLDRNALLADPARGRRTLTVIARRAPDATSQQLQASLAVFSRQQRELYPSVQGRQSWVALPLRDELVGPTMPVLVGTAIAATLLLLIVGANLAGLSVARAIAHRQQYAIRAALGAGRSRLLVERLIDSLAIAGLGSALGVWLAGGLIQVLASYQGQFLERLQPIRLDWTTALFGVAAGLALGIAAPLLSQSAVNTIDAADALRAGRSSSGGTRITVLRSGLVVLQVALAFVLVVGAGLLVRTVLHLADLPLGFRPEGLTAFHVNLTGPKYRAPEQHIQLEREVLAELRRIPGVTAATSSVGLPIVGGPGAALSIFGRSDHAGQEEVAYFSVSPGFLQTIGARLIAGREITETDLDSAPKVAVINEMMARRYWPEGNAIGARIQLGPGGPTRDWITVVGVVADMRQQGPVRQIRPTAFGSTYQYSWPRRYFTVQASGPVPVADLRAALRKVDPAVAMGPVMPLTQMAADQTARHRVAMLALAFFGTTAVVLCAFGLFAVVSLTSHLRRREYAIRLAVGASPVGIRWMVLRQGVTLALTGALAGAAIAAAGTDALSGLLHGVTPLDTAAFCAAALLVLSLAGLASWIPARQASRVDPLDSLRAE